MTPRTVPRGTGRSRVAKARARSATMRAGSRSTRRPDSFPARPTFQTNFYAFSNATPFQQYRLRVTATTLIQHLQLTEIRMFGRAASSRAPIELAAASRRERERSAVTSRTSARRRRSLEPSSFHQVVRLRVAEPGHAVSTAYDLGRSAAFPITRYAITTAMTSPTAIDGGPSRVRRDLRSRGGYGLGHARPPVEPVPRCRSISNEKLLGREPTAFRQYRCASPRIMAPDLPAPEFSFSEIRGATSQGVAHV